MGIPHSSPVFVILNATELALCLSQITIIHARSSIKALLLFPLKVLVFGSILQNDRVKPIRFSRLIPLVSERFAFIAGFAGDVNRQDMFGAVGSGVDLERTAAIRADANRFLLLFRDIVRVIEDIPATRFKRPGIKRLS